MNLVAIIGNITRDIELRYTTNGTAVAEFGIAHNDRDKNAHFFDVTAFGKQAETLHQYMRKGKKIAIQGRLRQNAWTASDGTKRSKVHIVLESFDFVGCKEDGEGGHGQRQAPGQEPSQYQPRPQPAQPAPQQAQMDYSDEDIPF